MELEIINKVEFDLPPEYCRYRDEGCDLADSCLNCPYDRCIYDQPGGKRGWLKELRTREITRLYTSEGKGVREMAVIFGVSQRTVQRALKATLDKPVGGGSKQEWLTALTRRN